MPDGKPARRGAKRRSGLRFEVLNAFVDEGLRTLKPADAVVWLILYRDTKPDGNARAAVDDLARRSGLSRSTVLRARALERLRMLRVVRRGGLNRGPSSYRVFPFPVPDDWGVDAHATGVTRDTSTGVKRALSLVSPVTPIPEDPYGVYQNEVETP